MKAGLWCENEGPVSLLRHFIIVQWDLVRASDTRSGMRIIITFICLEQYVSVG